MSKRDIFETAASSVFAALAAALLLAFLFFGRPARGQESVSYAVPARTVQLRASGERIAYLLDGGCTAQAETPIEVAPDPLNGAPCNASRTRARAQVADAVDGGASPR